MFNILNPNKKKRVIFNQIPILALKHAEGYNGSMLTLPLLTIYHLWIVGLCYTCMSTKEPHSLSFPKKQTEIGNTIRFFLFFRTTVCSILIKQGETKVAN